MTLSLNYNIKALDAECSYAESLNTNGTARFFAFWLIIEGATEKVLQSIMQVKLIYNKNLGFIEQKMYFWTLSWGSNKKKFIHWHHFCLDFFSNDLFKAALYRLMLVLHKDVLLHCKVEIDCPDTA